MGTKKPPSPAQIAARAAFAARARKQASTESVLSTASGSGVRAAGGGLKAHIEAHQVVVFDRAALGAMWSGFFAGMLSPQGRVDTSDLYPQGKDEKHADAELAHRRMYAQEYEIGRQLHAVLGKAAAFHGVTDAQWAAGLRAARRAAQTSATGDGTGDGGFQSPFDSAVGARVSEAFGIGRANGRVHRGVDLAAPVGSAVHAPAPGKVNKVWTEDEGGLCLRLALQAVDGGYAGDNTTGDDSGLFVTFAHLDAVSVKEGDEVARGDVVATSGNSGRNTTGPHLHVMSELFVDAPWSIDTADTRQLLDPVDLWGGEGRITGQEPPSALDALTPIDAIQVDAVAGAKVIRRGSVVVTAEGQLLWAGGLPLVRARALLDVRANQDRDNDGDGGWASQLPLPDAVRQQLAPTINEAAKAGRHVREIAGRVVEVLWKPETLQVALRGLGAGTSALGALAAPAGTLAGMLSGPANMIPYVGQGVSAALAGFAAAAPTIGIGLSGVGGVLSGAASIPSPESLGQAAQTSLDDILAYANAPVAGV